MAWHSTFDDPVLTPDGKQLHTLHEARTYILRLPERVVRHRRWQTAVEALLLVGDGDGPTDFARIALMQALYPGAMRPESADLEYRAPANGDSV